MAKFTIACHDCGKHHTFDGGLPFREECDQCSADLHVCLTCRFWDKHVENECREVTADPVAAKDRRNLCEYWKPRPLPGEEGTEADAAKAKLAALFGEGPAPDDDDPQAEAKAKLEALFKK